MTRSLTTDPNSTMQKTQMTTMTAEMPTMHKITLLEPCFKGVKSRWAQKDLLTGHHNQLAALVVFLSMDSRIR